MKMDIEVGSGWINGVPDRETTEAAMRAQAARCIQKIRDTSPEAVCGEILIEERTRFGRLDMMWVMLVKGIKRVRFAERLEIEIIGRTDRESPV